LKLIETPDAEAESDIVINSFEKHIFDPKRAKIQEVSIAGQQISVHLKLWYPGIDATRVFSLPTAANLFFIGGSTCNELLFAKSNFSIVYNKRKKMAVYANCPICRIGEDEIKYICLRVLLLWGFCRRVDAYLFKVEENGTPEELLVDLTGKGCEDVFKYMTSNKLVCRPDLQSDEITRLISEGNRQLRQTYLQGSLLFGEGNLNKTI
jgi:hypothetical protein